MTTSVQFVDSIHTKPGVKYTHQTRREVSNIDVALPLLSLLIDCDQKQAIWRKENNEFDDRK